MWKNVAIDMDLDATLIKLEPRSNKRLIGGFLITDGIGSGVKLISPMAFGTINRLADRGRRGCSISPTTFLKLEPWSKEKQ